MSVVWVLVLNSSGRDGDWILVLTSSIKDLDLLKTYLLMRWLGPDALAVCRAHRDLPVGFLLLRYSVLFTVESLSLLYLPVIS